MGRVGCILIPALPIAAMLRARPELRERPLALAATPAPHAELLAVSSEAAAAGVRSGMTVAQARAILPAIAIVRRAPEAEHAALEALCDAAESISPLVEPGPPDRAWFALEGLARLFVHDRNRAGEDDRPAAPAGIEAEIAAELKARAHRLGLEAAVGVGASKEVASLAARCGGVRVIDAGREREFLDWIPLDLLGLDEGLEITLARWGIRRLGELARLDPKALASRLGAAGLELARIARGEQRAPFVPRRRGESFIEKTELEYGVENLEPLAFLIRPMLERAVARIAMRGMVAGDIALELGLVDRGRDRRRVTVAAATVDVRVLLTLVTLSLEAAPPAAAVEALAIKVEARPARPAQADLFAPPAPAPGRLETTLARLAALCGPDQVGMLRAADSWRPEAAHLTTFAAPAPPPGGVAAPPPSRGNITRLAIRAIRPAEEVEMLCDRGAPEFVRGREIAARVVAIAGPWRRDGEWWDSAGRGFARDYYDLALGDGAVYRAYRDRHTDRWFVDGVYD